MSTKKKRNKAYKPKYVCRNVMSTIFGGNSDTHAEHTQSIKAKNHAAIARMVQGTGTRDDWHLIVGPSTSPTS